jgi:hypothetical protein
MLLFLGCRDAPERKQASSRSRGGEVGQRRIIESLVCGVTCLNTAARGARLPSAVINEKGVARRSFGKSLRHFHQLSNVLLPSPPFHSSASSRRVVAVEIRKSDGATVMPTVCTTSGDHPRNLGK